MEAFQKFAFRLSLVLFVLFAVPIFVIAASATAASKFMTDRKNSSKSMDTLRLDSHG